MPLTSITAGTPPRRAVAIAVVVLLAVAACATPIGPPAPTPSPSPAFAATEPPAPTSSPDPIALNRATVAAWIGAVRERDAARLAALYAPDATFDDPPEHRPDRAGVQATYAEVFGYEQLGVDPAVVLVGEDGAVLSWTYEWCNTSITPCPSQHVTTTTGVSVFRMDDGVITNETIYYIGGGEPN
jgi:ketosteroid isomerase-like protein